MDVLQKLFEQHFHTPAGPPQPVSGKLGGSGRNIFRLTSDKISAIGILYNVREENIAFLEFSRHFRRHGLPVPEIYAEDLSQHAYLEEDLGDRDAVAPGQGPHQRTLMQHVAVTHRGEPGRCHLQHDDLVGRRDALEANREGKARGSTCQRLY